MVGSVLHTSLVSVEDAALGGTELLLSAYRIIIIRGRGCAGSCGSCSSPSS
jgi:hypothetical protein